MLDGCYFLKEKAPPHPQHPDCHCLLYPISYNTVLKNAKAISDYGKCDPYLFNVNEPFDHKNICFSKNGVMMLKIPIG